jgi:CMP-N,N'-diacetyllegionaminic acid synthase
LTALIPARGGSKEIPKKNIKLFNGKPLIAWTIEFAIKSNAFERIVVSTDDVEIADISKYYGAEVPFLRPKKLSQDTTPGIEVILHFVENTNTEKLMVLQPTSPLRGYVDLNGVCKKSITSQSVVSITKSKYNPEWMYYHDPKTNIITKYKVTKEITPNRQDLKEIYNINGAFYYFNCKRLMETKQIINKDTMGYVMPHNRSIDIDTINDWKLAEYYFKNKCS